MICRIVTFEVILDVFERFDIRGLLSWVCSRDGSETGMIVVVVTSVIWPERMAPFTGLLDDQRSGSHLETRGLFVVCLPEK